MLRSNFIGCALWLAIAAVAQSADDPFTALAERYTAQEARYAEALKKATTDEQRKEVNETLSPRHALVQEFLAIESSHRGQPAAISALYRLAFHATSAGDPDSPASRGRVEVIQILRKHYLEHPDLNLLLGQLNSGVLAPEAEGLLLDATKSPHRQVRAAARHQLAQFLANKASLAEIFGPEAPPVDPELATRPLAMELQRKLRDRVKLWDIDPIAERERAVNLIDELVADYADVEQSFVKQEGPGKLSVRRASADEFGVKAKTYAEYGEALRFELQHLQRGQTVPDITAKDAEGTEFKLSDYRGRVVLLTFSANWCGPCKAMYPNLRKLTSSLEAEPFAVLAVMGDKEIDTVIQDTKSGDIRWRTWFDGDSGPIATAWNVHSWPTVFLIDHNGVIVQRDPGRSYETLRKLIDKLLAAQKADPQARRQVAEHPLPELPILKRAE